MRVWEKSAEAEVAKKFWKQNGAKGRRTKRQTDRTTPRNGEQYSETGERCNSGSYSPGGKELMVDSMGKPKLRNASQPWAKEK